MGGGSAYEADDCSEADSVINIWIKLDIDHTQSFVLSSLPQDDRVLPNTLAGTF